MEDVVKAVLNSMSSVKKSQRLFIMRLFSVLVVFQGKVTFRNLSAAIVICMKSVFLVFLVATLTLLYSTRGLLNTNFSEGGCVLRCLTPAS